MVFYELRSAEVGLGRRIYNFDCDTFSSLKLVKCALYIVGILGSDIFMSFHNWDLFMTSCPIFHELCNKVSNSTSL